MECVTIYYLLDYKYVIFYNEELDIEIACSNYSGMFNQSPIVKIEKEDLIRNIGILNNVRCEYMVLPENVVIITI